MPSTAQLPACPSTPLFRNGVRMDPAGSASTISTSGCTRAKNRLKSRERAAAADAADHGVHVVAGLVPDFGAGAGFVGERIGRVGELVDVEGTGISCASRAARS